MGASRAAAETYFPRDGIEPLNLDQAATLAGIVEDPARYEPDQQTRFDAMARRKHGADPDAADPQPPAWTPRYRGEGEGPGRWASHPGQVMSGLHGPPPWAITGFFCDYVIHTMLLDKALRRDPRKTAAKAARHRRPCRSTTTVSKTDENSATYAVLNYVLPPPQQGPTTPAGNAATTAMVAPGTGRDHGDPPRNRAYGNWRRPDRGGLTTPCPPRYGGANGVADRFLVEVLPPWSPQLQQGRTVSAFQGDRPRIDDDQTAIPTCAGDPAGYANGQSGVFPVSQLRGDRASPRIRWSPAPPKSINVFLQPRWSRRSACCNVVKTAASLGIDAGGRQVTVRL